jgi:large subunit ribosomal protein L23
MSRIFKRALASVSEAAAAISTPKPTRPPSSSSTYSRNATQPIAVRERQATYLAGTDKVQSKNGLPSFTPSQEIRFQTLRAEGKLPGDEATAREQFLKDHDAWRSRVRGHRQVLNVPQNYTPEQPETLSSPAKIHQFKDAMDVPSVESLAAQRIYLPNIQIRLMRNHTAPGEPYDTSIATFRIPPSMTKNDLRSYLFAVYGLPVTFIRTDNYIAPQARVGTQGSMKRIKGSEKTYKRAVVGLETPFHYPDDVAELDALIDSPATDAEAELRRSRAIDGKKKREEWLNAQFMSDLQVSQKKRSMMKLAKGWRWRGQTHDNNVSPERCTVIGVLVVDHLPNWLCSVCRETSYGKS